MNNNYNKYWLGNRIKPDSSTTHRKYAGNDYGSAILIMAACLILGLIIASCV